VRTTLAGSLRFPEQRQSSQGESGAKPRLRSVGDAQAVHILLPPMTVRSLSNSTDRV
jgi:hypothetical protein